MYNSQLIGVRRLLYLEASKKDFFNSKNRWGNFQKAREFTPIKKRFKKHLKRIKIVFIRIILYICIGTSRVVAQPLGSFSLKD